jgi:hypothetical protein
VVPERVAAHYLSLSVDELMEDVLRHYRLNVWPLVESIVQAHVDDPGAGRLVVEGSALWPESVATLDCCGVVAIWLTAGQSLFRRRIHTASDYTTRSPREKAMVDKFLDRTLRYNEQMMTAVRRLGLSSMRVEDGVAANEMVDRCLAAIASDTPKLDARRRIR